MLLAPLRHLVRRLAYSISTCASIRGAGALCRGYTYPRSSLPAHGITVLQREVPLNGYGVSHAAIFIPCYIPPIRVSAGFIVTKFTPQIISSLGYKIFLMFATVNIGAMATFS